MRLLCTALGLGLGLLLRLGGAPRCLAALALDQLAALALLTPFATGMSLLALAAGAAGVLIAVAAWEEMSIRATRRAEGRPVSHDAEQDVEFAEAG